MFLPERDKYSQSKLEIKAMMASLFGGRVAEELIFGEDKVTTGASDDIRRATGLARRMVTEFGFSDKLGPLRYAENEEEVFLGHSVTQRKNVSDATAKVIDDEIRRIVDEGERTAREILTGASRRAAPAGQGAARIRDAVGRRDPAGSSRASGSCARPRRPAAARRARRAGAARCRPRAGRADRPRTGAAAGRLRPIAASLALAEAVIGSRLMV